MIDKFTGHYFQKVYKYLPIFLFAVLLLTGCSVGVSSGANPVSGVSSGAGLEVHYLDVGQGDSTLIKVGDHAMLIDAGDNSEGTAVQSYLESQNIEKLDYVIGTHPDSDHIGGLDVVIYKFDCEKVFMPDVTSDTRTYDDVVQALKAKRMKAQSPKVGKSYELGEASFTIIAPLADYGNETNNWSIELLLTYGENRFLFTGDAEKAAEEDILAGGADISADVYKASHHGSKTGSSEEFLDAVNPAYVVISCGEGNKYGHPSAQTLINLRSRGIKMFRTDRQGAIVATSDGKKITFNTSPSDDWTPGEPTGSAAAATTRAKAATSKKTTTQKTTAQKKSTQKSATYVINEDTRKFHRTTCRYAKAMSGENRTDTTKTKSALLKEGYEACKVCNP